MSTRVHELARELGLKSQELLEHIQKWGLDVKVNALASLEPPTVERIKELMRRSTAATGARERRPQAGGCVGPGVRAECIRRSAAGRPRRCRPLRRAQRQAGRRRAPLRRRPRRVTSAWSPAPLLPARLIRSRRAPTRADGSSAGMSGSGPLSRPGGGFSGTRPRGGPLSAHTPHRGTSPRPRVDPQSTGPRRTPEVVSRLPRRRRRRGAAQRASSRSSRATTCRRPESVP